MKKTDVVQAIFHQTIPDQPSREKGLAYAPTNIALCKYWGKRDAELNLPVTSSLSVALPDKGTMTTLTLQEGANDRVILNGDDLALETAFVKRLSLFLDLFRPNASWRACVDIKVNIPVAAGLASSASGFASLVLALNDWFEWTVSKRDLSILARLGSGSATRSLWNGFVEWIAGGASDGMDSYGQPLIDEWPDLCVGLLVISEDEKPLSSREAMQRTVSSSLLYGNWPKKAGQDLMMLKQALHAKNFSLFGGIAESNALSMHATLLSSWPPICYFLPETIAAMHRIWHLRQQGLELFFTQDAGPNLKLLFLEKETHHVKAAFPSLDVVKVFE